jgi:hypothetical protein
MLDMGFDYLTGTVRLYAKVVVVKTLRGPGQSKRDNEKKIFEKHEREKTKIIDSSN